MHIEVRDPSLVERLRRLLPRPDAPFDDVIIKLLEQPCRLRIREIVEEVLDKHLPRFRLTDGALEALRGLRAMGHRVEIATNGHATYQLPVIRRLGLDELVDGVRTSDAYRCPKTCPEYFQGADLMVGDNPVFDVYFPKRFGLLAIFYGDWEREAAEHARRLAISINAVRPDGVVKSLAELPDAVRRALALR